MLGFVGFWNFRPVEICDSVAVSGGIFSGRPCWVLLGLGGFRPVEIWGPPEASPDPRGSPTAPRDSPGSPGAPPGVRGGVWGAPGGGDPGGIPGGRGGPAGVPTTNWEWDPYNIQKGACEEGSLKFLQALIRALGGVVGILAKFKNKCNGGDVQIFPWITAGGWGSPLIEEKGTSRPGPKKLTIILCF